MWITSCDLLFDFILNYLLHYAVRQFLVQFGRLESGSGEAQCNESFGKRKTWRSRAEERFRVGQIEFFSTAHWFLKLIDKAKENVEKMEQSHRLNLFCPSQPPTFTNRIAPFSFCLLCLLLYLSMSIIICPLGFLHCKNLHDIRPQTRNTRHIPPKSAFRPMFRPILDLNRD